MRSHHVHLMSNDVQRGSVVSLVRLSQNIWEKKAMVKKKYRKKAAAEPSLMWMLFNNIDVICSLAMVGLTLYIFLRRRFSKTWTPGKKAW